MATLTIRNLDDDIKERLRIQAAKHGHSMEEEARNILKRSVGGISGDQLWTLSRQLFADDKGVEMPLPSRDKDREAPDFTTDKDDDL